MNCQGFAATLVDLARHEEVDAGDRQMALAHAESCATCALRLADERALTGGLGAAAIDDIGMDAPLRVEGALRAAFLAQHTPVRRSLWRRPMVMGAAAGAIAAGVVMFGVLPLRRPARAPFERVPVRPEPRSQARAQLRPLQMITPVYRPQRRVKQTTAMARAVRQEPGTVREAPEPVEVATDFLPIAGDGAADIADRARLVRIKLPRTALRSFGLPFNEDRAAEPIDADVLLGEDGQARALRFVETRFTPTKERNQ